MKRFAIIGLGSFGSSLVATLAEKKDCEIIAIDKDEKRVNEIREMATRPIVMEVSDKESLLAIGIKESDIAVVAAGPALEPSIMIVHLLGEIGVKRIIAKALSKEHAKILKVVGATEVTYPERDIAKKIASRLSHDNLLDYLPVESGLVVHEIAPPESFIGKTLSGVRLRQDYNVTVIAIKSLIPDETIPNPGADFIIKESDILIVFGTEEDINKLHKKITA